MLNHVFANGAVTLMAKDVPISAEEVSSVLDYNRETGEFRWKIRASSRKRPGDLAGYYTAQGYLRINLLGRSVPAHRIAWLLCFGEWPSAEVDHINRDKTDNRLANLRAVSTLENALNKDSNIVGGSGKGCFKLPSGRWHATVKVNGRTHYVGRFDTQEEGKQASAAASLRLRQQQDWGAP